jgi:Protein kinase domain
MILGGFRPLANLRAEVAMSEIPTEDWSWINAAADRFERAWKAGPRPRIEDFLAEVDESRWPPLLAELLRVESELRRHPGDEPDPEEYHRRFPNSAAVIETFFNPVEASTAPGQSTTKHVPAHQPILEGPGSRIGPYKLLQQIGEGGMGTVYMAEQEKPVRRRVALKVIKPGMDTGQVIARFEAERQALALMEHQHIAKVLDAGATDTGRPYFVMELVRGVPITDYCSPARRRSSVPGCARPATTRSCGGSARRRPPGQARA